MFARAVAPRSVIRVTNLRLRTFVGFNQEEREKKQDVVVNMRIVYDARMASATDSVDHALDYKRITKQVIQHVEANRFLLLEKLSADILDIAMAEPATEGAWVEVDKPHALRFADSVSMVQISQRDGSDGSLTQFLLHC